MNKNILIVIIVVLVVICFGEAAFVLKERNAKLTLSRSFQRNTGVMGNAPIGARPKSTVVMKGQKFSDSDLFSKAYLIFPVTGNLTPEAQTALLGWDVKTTANRDSSTQVDLVPKEAGDIKQSFTVKPGSKLYFIEMTLADDQTGIDLNRGDDIGVLIDQNGIVQ